MTATEPASRRRSHVVASMFRGAARDSAVVAVGLGVLGISAYVFLAASGRALGPVAAGPLAVWWTIVNTVIVGVLTPVEQETGRLVAVARASGRDPLTLVRSAAAIVGGAVAVAAAGLLIMREPLADAAFRGHRVMVDLTALVAVVMAAVYLSRGVLAGTGAYRSYGLQLGIEGTIRGAGAVVLLAAGVGNGAAFGVVVALGGAVALTATWPRPARDPSQPPAAAHPWTFTRRLGLLVAGAAVSGILLNAPPLLVEVFGGGAATATMLALLTVSRLPLFAFAAVQAVVLPRLAAARVAGRRAFIAQFRQALFLVVGLALAGAAVCGGLGPEIVRLAFGAAFVVARSDALVLAAAGAAFMVALLLTQTVIAQERHTVPVLCWSLGALAMAAGLWAVPGLIEKVAVASLLASLVALASLAAAVRQGMRRDPALAVGV